MITILVNYQGKLLKWFMFVQNVLSLFGQKLDALEKNSILKDSHISLTVEEIG